MKRWIQDPYGIDKACPLAISVEDNEYKLPERRNRIMRLHVIEHQGVSIARVESEHVLIRDVDTALDLMADVHYQAKTRSIIIDASSLDPRFFDLSTRLAGEILQKFVTYSVRLAIVGDFSRFTSKSLRDFIRESNQGTDIFFCTSEEEAVLRLAG
jgi:hypothetical protein